MYFRNICLGLITATILFAGTAGGFFLVHLTRITLPGIDRTVADLDVSAKDLDKSTQNLNVLIDSVSTTVDNVNDTATEEQKFLKLESQRFLEITNSTKLLVQGLDINLNRPQTGLLPKINSDLDQQNAALLVLQKQSTDTLAHTQVVVDGLVPIEKHLDDTTVVVSTTVAQVGPEFVATSKSIHSAADDGKEVADVYKAKLLHPFRSIYNDLATAGKIGLGILQAHFYWP
jgi:hypothetical protein